MTVRSATLLSLALISSLATTGCNIRGKAQAKPETSPEVASLQDENARLNDRIKGLEEELTKNKGGTVADDVTAIQGGEIEGFEKTAKGGVALPDDFAFAKGSADLNDEGQKAVARLAQRLNEAGNADKQIIVEGHTDHTPVSRPVTKEKYTDNWGLSAARSASVVRALEAAGVNPLRIQGAFRGKYQPRVAVSADKKDDSAGEAANRRVEIYLSK
jgi:flagellar motor protein MotB